jgi:hypothetical protein
MVDDYVYGFAMRESTVPEANLGDVSDALLDYYQRQLDSGEYPHIEELARGSEPREVFARIMAVMFDEPRFDRGLDRLLDGVARDIERRAAPG